MAEPWLYPCHRGVGLSSLRQAFQKRSLSAATPCIARADAPVSAIGLQQPRLRVICQIALKRFLNDALTQTAIFGEAGFYAPES